MPESVNLAPSHAWRSILASTLLTLRQLSGSTEKDFLHLGRKMQHVYARATELSHIARQLIDIASGERINALVEQLRHILSQLILSLGHAESRTLNNYNQINQISSLIKKLGQPVEDFRIMAKQLYIFEVLIRIESTYIKENGNEFINIASDIRNLSSQIKIETNEIRNKIESLLSVLSIHCVFYNKEMSNGECRRIASINNTEKSIINLIEINSNYTEYASVIDSISTENSNNISSIIESIQIHDTYRQQVDHVIDAINDLVVNLDESGCDKSNKIIDFIRMAGDVCEIQHAQLNFASTNLYDSVELIINKLNSIFESQLEISRSSFNSIDNNNEISIISDVSSSIRSVTDLISEYDKTGITMDKMMNDVVKTMEDITSFVHNVEIFSSDIIQIALNARIKAVATGQDGAAMSSLSDEVGQLSKRAVHRTEIISQSMGEVHEITKTIVDDTDIEEIDISTRFKEMQDQMQQLFAELESIGCELKRLVQLMSCQDRALAQEIKQITNDIDVHKRIQQRTHAVLNNLKEVFTSARNLYPADEAFKKELLDLAARYTMESERRVHMEIAQKHGARIHYKTEKMKKPPDKVSEFGDNVDLF